MVSFTRLICLTLLIGYPVSAFALDDTPQNRAKEAARYMQAVPPESAATGMIKNIALSLPEQQQKTFAAAMQKNLNAAAIKSAAEAGLVKVFTADELKAMADFYSSPAGKSAMAKMGSYMAASMPAIEKEVDAAVTKAEKETGIKLEAKQ
jgi:hypothetical protein